MKSVNTPREALVFSVLERLADNQSATAQEELRLYQEAEQKKAQLRKLGSELRDAQYLWDVARHRAEWPIEEGESGLDVSVQAATEAAGHAATIFRLREERSRLQELLAAVEATRNPDGLTRLWAALERL